MVKFSVPKPKKPVAVLIIVIACLLIGLGVYLVINKSSSGGKTLTSAENSTVFAAPTKDNCNTNIDNFNKINTDSLNPKEASKVFNYRGNCYLIAYQYQKALDAYKQKLEVCKKAKDQDCINIAKGEIDTAQYYIDHSKGSGAQEQ